VLFSYSPILLTEIEGA